MWVYLICWFHKVIMKSGRSSTFIFLGNNALMLLTWLCSRSSIDVALFFGGLIFLKAVRLFSAVKIGVFEPCHLLSLSCWIWEQLSQQRRPVLLPWQFARHPADRSNLIFQRLRKSLPSTAFLFVLSNEENNSWLQRMLIPPLSMFCCKQIISWRET